MCKEKIGGCLERNASSQFVPGITLDRHFQYQTYKNIFTGKSGVGSLTSQSISAGVPAAVRTADIVLASAQAGSTLVAVISPDSTGTGGQGFTVALAGGTQSLLGGLGTSYVGMASFQGIPLITSQTVYWSDSNVNANDAMFASGYSF